MLLLLALVAVFVICSEEATEKLETKCRRVEQRNVVTTTAEDDNNHIQSDGRRAKDCRRCVLVGTETATITVVVVRCTPRGGQGRD